MVCTQTSSSSSSAAKSGRAPRVSGAPAARPTRRRWALALIPVVALIVVAVVALRSGGSSSTSLTTGSTTRPVEFLGAGNHATEGTLVTPAGATIGKTVPAVLIVPDEGAVDRDGLTPVGATPDHLYADLADNLAAKGIASLRYDPRGAIYANGQTSLAQGATLQYQDLVGDAQAGLKFLAAQGAVNSADLGVVGDGVGGLVALSAATAGPAPRAVVLLSTPGRPVIDSMSDQLLADAPTPADGQAAVAQLQDAATLLANGSSLPDPGQGATDLRTVLTPDRDSYLKTLFSLSPATLAGGVHLPALIVQGGKDPALTAGDEQALAGAFGAQARVLDPPNDSRTLTMTITGAGTGPTTSLLGMQEFMTGSGPSTIRDSTTFGSIISWLSSHLR
ncbi:MAG: serine aminopeptidase domain-containing protein [Acidimicrobiales bacterium]